MAYQRTSAELPASILANREAYLQGDWRTQPYIPRYNCPSHVTSAQQMCPKKHRAISSNQHYSYGPTFFYMQTCRPF